MLQTKDTSLGVKYGQYMIAYVSGNITINISVGAY